MSTSAASSEKGLPLAALSRTKEEVYHVFDFDPTEPVDAFTVTTSVHRREVTGRHFHLEGCQDAAFHDALMPGDPTAALSADTSDRLGRQERVRILSWNPGFARGRMSAVGGLLLGPWHIVAWQVEASTFLNSDGPAEAFLYILHHHDCTFLQQAPRMVSCFKILRRGCCAEDPADSC